MCIVSLRRQGLCPGLTAAKRAAACRPIEDSPPPLLLQQSSFGFGWCRARVVRQETSNIHAILSMDQNSDSWTGSLALEVDEMRHSLARRVIRKGFSAEHRVLAMLAAVLPRLSPLPRSTARSSSTLGLVAAAPCIASGTHRCRATNAQRHPLRAPLSLTRDVRRSTGAPSPASEAGASTIRLDRTHVLHERIAHTRVRGVDEAVLREA